MQNTKTGDLIFFAIVDDRLGLKEGTQDQKILYYNSILPFDTLVVNVGHMQTVMGICKQFKGKTKYFKTKLTITFFVSPKDHIYFMLRVGRTNSTDVFFPFLSHLSSLYSMLQNDEYVASKKKTMFDIFDPIFENYSFSEILTFDFNFFKMATLTYKSYLYLSTIVERTKQKYQYITNFFIIYGRTILYSDLSRNDTLTLYLLLSRMIQPEQKMVGSELSSLIVNPDQAGWILDDSSLIPFFLEHGNERRKVYLGMYNLIKEDQKMLFIPIFSQSVREFFTEFDCEVLYERALKEMIDFMGDANILFEKTEMPLHLLLSFSTNCLKTNLTIKTKSKDEFEFVLFIREMAERISFCGGKMGEVWINSSKFQWVAARFALARELFVFSKGRTELNCLKTLTEQTGFLSSSFY
ncbi:hypothetical protein EIN_185450 [Entamoeba invadens IP1]|uniref:hypothetical protein n=1 Tax=Entamoeba invadens IP1 TaxID=370355 RepID=UPI0002C3EF6C|nr:hypothetical protein EIN_185450 [Entamoeba invadens IP1]ELP94158.1 hypothetical protein EIN_185450 [Entamoeba invadens IP1]|eukprot:XP_004260929.1 hypothetical protein EIN_185450 [Entamoeba invadens IP1]